MPVSGNVSENDTYVCSGPITLGVKVGSVKYGTVTDFNAQTGAYTFLPAVNFTGQASFWYEVFCNGNKVAEAQVFISVSPACDVCTELAIIKQLLRDQNCGISELLAKIKHL